VGFVAMMFVSFSALIDCYEITPTVLGGAE
jgi:hypothetical protein